MQFVIYRLLFISLFLFSFHFFTREHSPSHSFEELDKKYGISSLDGFTKEHKKRVDWLLKKGQQHVFENWDGPGINNEQKFDFFEKLLKFDQAYPSGLNGYLALHNKLINAWRTGDNPDDPYKGVIPKVPTQDIVEVSLENSDSFEQWEAIGLQQAKKLAIVLVAGGLGSRLKAKEIKLALPTEPIFHMSNLERYARWIKIIQEETNQINQSDIKIPLFIMTSEDTHEVTIKLLEDNNYFNLDKNQIHLMKQDSVPAITPSLSKICRNSADKYQLKMGGSGHGAVHKLMYDYGFAEMLSKEGKYILFVLDSNPQVTNGVLVALSQSIIWGWDLNFLAIQRDPKETCHVIVDVADSLENKKIRACIDYSHVDAKLKSLGLEGDVADPQTGLSRYPGYSGVLIIDAKAYCPVLQKTRGIVLEKVKPKNEDDEVRIESQFEDIAFFFQKNSKIGITYFKDKRFVFSPVKNCLERAISLQAKGNYPDAQGTSEADFLKENRRLLKEAGVDIQVNGKPFSVGYSFEEGAKVILTSNFMPTRASAKRKFLGNISISSDSLLALSGKNITFKNVILDGGGLIIDIPDDIKLHVHDLILKGCGWHYKEDPLYTYSLERMDDTPLIDTRSPEISKIFFNGGSGHYEMTQINGSVVVRKVRLYHH